MGMYRARPEFDLSLKVGKSKVKQNKGFLSNLSKRHFLVQARREDYANKQHIEQTIRRVRLILYNMSNHILRSFSLSLM